MSGFFQTVGLFGQVKNDGVSETLTHLMNHFTAQSQAWVIEKNTAEHLNVTQDHVVSRESLSKACDVVVVVGGDGSLLHAAQLVIQDETPVIGINRGKLGFLTDVSPLDFETIDAMLNGKYQQERRFLLEASIHHESKIIGKACALNEVALIPDTIPHMNTFELYVDDAFVCSQHADGLIIATPTGSTAYALSGGGPILHPELDAIVMVPMFPHTLNQRPIVIHGDQTIRLVISPDSSYNPRITCDGQQAIDTPLGSHIIIQKMKQSLHLLHPLKYDYYASLRSKLGWGKKLIHAD